MLWYSFIAQGTGGSMDMAVLRSVIRQSITEHGQLLPCLVPIEKPIDQLINSFGRIEY